MATPTEDDDSTLKRRARRRLIGAIALALLAVIVLPAVFDAEKKPLDADISIQIPDREALVTKGPGARAVPPPDGKGDAGTDAKSAAKPDVKADAKTEAKADMKAEAKADAKGEAKGEAKGGEPRAPAVAKAGDARSAKDLAEEKRAAAILNAQAEAKSAKVAPAEGGFAVQVGAFAAADKVKEARDKLGAAGIKTYTEKLDTKDGERTRVRAGPFAAKESAEAARDQIRGLGFANANVVTR